MTLESLSPPAIPDYELLKPIGRGSYGEVWLARSLTGVFRVIKVVHRNRFEDARPFRRELEGISRFQAAVSGRPRQLALLHVGRNDEAGFFYYVMEPADDAETGSAIDPERYVPLTLRELFKRRGRIPASECVELGLELARGLAVLHGENLIHRDIKPSNIIFVQRVPKLADVGLVASTDATLTGVGTPGYLPPEGPGSKVADIYSLGKVLYELATGLDRMEFPRIPPELADVADAPLLREVNAIVLKACHRNPAERHPNAEAFARDLELIQAGKSVVFYENLRRRTRIVVATTVTLAILAAVAAGQVLWRSSILKRANQETRRALYRSDLAVAQLARASGDLGRARTALQLQVPKAGQKDLRGLEWAILARAVRGEGAPLETISDPTAVRKLAVDSTGRWVAGSFTDDRVALWDLHTGRITRVITNAQVLGGFLPDGRLLVDEPSRVLRYETPYEPSTAVRRITGLRLRQLLPDGRVLTLSPKGDFVFRILKAEDDRVDAEFNASARWPGAQISSSTVTPNGDFLAIALFVQVGAVRDRLLAAVQLSTGRELWRVKASSRLGWIRASPDNYYIAANVGGLSPLVLRIDDVAFRRTLEGHEARVQDASFSPSGRFIATASADQTIRVWETESGRPLSTHRGLGRPATAVAWLPSGALVVAGDEGGNVRIFGFPQRNTSDSVSGLFGDLHGDLAFSPDEHLVAVTKATNVISMINVGDLQEAYCLTNLFQPIAFSPTGGQLYAFANDWSLWKVDVPSGRRYRVGAPLPREFSVDAWALSPDSKSLAMAGSEGRLVFFDLDLVNTARAADLETNRIWAITFSPDSSEIWTGNVKGTIRRWRTADGHPISDVSRVDGDLQALALSPDGHWLAASLFNDASVRIWDIKKEQWLTPMHVHRRFVQSLVFTPDGDRLISGGADGRIVVCRVPEFEEVASFDVEQILRSSGDEGIASLRLAPRLSCLAALTEDGRLQLWRAR